MEEAITCRVQDAAVATTGASAQVTTQHWWDQASTLYNITTPAMIYQIFVQIWEWRMSPNKPPQGQLDHLLMLYNQLKAEGQTLLTLTRVQQGSSSKTFQKKGKGKACARGTQGKGQKAWKPRVNFLEQQAVFNHTAMLTEKSRTTPTLHMVLSIRPSSISTRVKTKSSISSIGTNSMWPTFNATMCLANCIGECSMGSIQALEMLMMTVPISQVVQQSIFPSALNLTPDYNVDELSCSYTKEEHYTTRVNNLVAGGCTYWPTKIK